VYDNNNLPSTSPLVFDKTLLNNECGNIITKRIKRKYVRRNNLPPFNNTSLTKENILYKFNQYSGRRLNKSIIHLMNQLICLLFND
jgi:hypothetical protein